MMAKQLVKPPQVAADVYEELKAKATQLVSSSNIEELQLKVDAEAKELNRLEGVVENLSIAMGKVGAVEGELKEDNQRIKEEVQRLEKAVEEACSYVQKHDTCVSMLTDGTSKVQGTWEEVKAEASSHFASLITTSKEHLLTANPSLPPDHPVDLASLKARKTLLQAVLSGNEGAPHTSYPEVIALTDKSERLKKTLAALQQMNTEEEALASDATHTYADRYSRLTKHHNVIDELYRDPAVCEELGGALLVAGEHCREAMKTARVKATNVSEVMAVAHDLQMQSEEGDVKVAASGEAIAALQKEVSRGREAVSSLQGEVSGGMGQLEALQKSIEETGQQHNAALADVASRSGLLEQLVGQHVSGAKEARELTTRLRRDFVDAEVARETLKRDIEKRVAMGLGSVVVSKRSEVDNVKKVTEYFFKQQRELGFVDMALDGAYAAVTLSEGQLGDVENIVAKYTTALQQESTNKENLLKTEMSKLNTNIQTTYEVSDDTTNALKIIQQQIDALVPQLVTIE